MLVVKFTLFGRQDQKTIDELVKSGYTVVKDSFTGKDGSQIICYRICAEEEEA